MSHYIPPVDDMAFLLTEVFDFDTEMSSLPAYAEINAELAVNVLEEGGKFCAEMLAPLNRIGDEEGSRLENGVVVTPKGFADAYAAFTQAGWGALSGDPAFGGQGLPRVLQILFDEMVSSSNLSFGLFPGLTRGAAEAVSQHASDDLKAVYLPKMVSGEWTGAMALTESSAGTDLGLLRARAVPRSDGSYAVTGTKIFISSGDHDFGGNIIHLVLARLPDAPRNVKGISLFLVPKYLPDAGGGLGARNAVSVGSLEQKMGIHAQPTCVMNYDEATGWLVGEPNRGLQAMFTMMNAERLFVGIQGLSIASASYQKAALYAKERLQGRPRNGAHEPVAIVEHLDVRRMLLTMRSFVEAGRALAVWTALHMDRAANHPDAASREQADGLVALLTPVIKAAFTDFGFEAAVIGQQVFGGHGYIREWGMEQLVRDARITQIYEGTNGVQALDLVNRKLSLEGGDLPRRFFAIVARDLEEARAVAGAEELAVPVVGALDRLRRATERLQQNGGDAAELEAAATDYLRLFALVALGWMWVRIAARALVDRDKTSLSNDARIATARFFISRLLPQTVGLELSLAAGARPLAELGTEIF